MCLFSDISVDIYVRESACTPVQGAVVFTLPRRMFWRLFQESTLRVFRGRTETCRQQAIKSIALKLNQSQINEMRTSAHFASGGEGGLKEGYGNNVDEKNLMHVGSS